MFKRSLSALAVAAALTLPFSANAAFTAITLNPQASNSLAIAPGQISPTVAAFQTDNLIGALASTLNITNRGAGNLGSWDESGGFVFTTALFQGFGTVTPSGISKLFGTPGASYDLFGNFSGSGGGQWDASTTIFKPLSITSFTIDLYAKVGGLTPSPTVFTPTGVDTSGAVHLGQAVFSGTFSGGEAALGGLGTSGQAQTSLKADFNFIPDAGYANTDTYSDGFFAAPIPFSIQLNTSGGSDSGASTFLQTGSSVTVTTGATRRGSLDVTFEHEIPEPGSVALVGLGLLGASLARRKIQNNA